MPTVVQFGAGNIGRGFMSQLWTESGYEVVFVDVNAELVDALNERRSYPLRLIENAGHQDLTIAPVRALNGQENIVSVAATLARCTFACTAVGVNIFPHLASALAKAVVARTAIVANGWKPVPREPLNVLCCENQAGAGAMLRAAVADALALRSGERARRYFEENVAFVDASVGRMVPVPTPELLAEDPLLVAAEPYKELPIDADAWLGPVPKIAALQPTSNFAGYVARKLFTHNGGHAVLAYLGYQSGHAYIWQAADDPAIVPILQGAWQETGAALAAAYGFDKNEQARHQEDLLHRFRNRALGDTAERVARDPLRKLRPDDRLVGGALLCLQHGITPTHVCKAIAAALRYDAPGDPTAAQVQGEIRRSGVAAALHTLCGLPADSPLTALVDKAYGASPPFPLS